MTTTSMAAAEHNLVRTAARPIALTAGMRVRGFALAVAIGGACVVTPVVANVGVSAAGDPTYTRAIRVPPGQGGLQPELSLVYTGGTATGRYGVGWELSGLSQITRCSASKALDGRAVPVKHVETDKLCLDGERLIPLGTLPHPAVSLTSPDSRGLAAGEYREYRAENTPYAKIRAYGALDPGNLAAGPLYFRVFGIDGSTTDYGNSPVADSNTNATARTKSRLAGTLPEVAHAWAVSRRKDASGNFIDFKYKQEDVTWGSTTSGYSSVGREWYLVEVQYSGNKVVFSYEAKPTAEGLQDIAEGYVAGAKFVSSKRLAHIATYINSPNTSTLDALAGIAVPVATTKFTYTTETGCEGCQIKTGRSVLDTIQTCSGAPASPTAKCLTPEKFDYWPGGGETFAVYNDPAWPFGLRDVPLVPTGGVQYGVILLDANGDGITDLLRWSSTASLNRLYISDGAGQFAAGANFNKVMGSQNRCYQTFPADFNGDGLVDLVRYSATGKAPDGTTNCNGGPSTLFRNDGNGAFTELPTSGVALNIVMPVETASYPDGGPAYMNITPGERFYAGDFTGDGNLDFFILKYPGFNGPLTQAYSTDHCAVNAIECNFFYRGRGDGTFEKISTPFANRLMFDTNTAYGASMNSNVTTSGDFDGDGIADIFTGSTILLSQGDGSFVPRYLETFCLTGETSYYCPVLALDFNGDRAVDFVVPGRLGQSNRLYVGHGHDGATTSWRRMDLWNMTSGTNYLIQPLGTLSFVMDINRDGRDDVIRLAQGGPPTANTWTSAVFLSRGDGNFSPSLTWNLEQEPLYKEDGTILPYFGNFTGLGGVEIIVAKSGGPNVLYVKGVSGFPDKLKSVTDSNGHTTHIHYVPLTKSVLASGEGAGPHYKSDRGTAFAGVGNLVDFVDTRWVVASLERPSGVGTELVREEYAYAGLKYDKDAGASAGFRVFKRQAPGADGTALTTTTVFQQSGPHRGRPVASSLHVGVVGDAAPSRVLNTTEIVYCNANATPAQVATALATKQSCPSSGTLNRPYVLWSQTTSKDLDGVTPLPTKAVHTTAVSPHATPLSTTTTHDAQFQTIRTVTPAPDIQSCDDIYTCKEWLDRPAFVVTRKVVPDALPTVSAGSGPNASSTSGSSVTAGASISPAGPYSFGSVAVGSTSATTTFAVVNTGTRVLVISGTTVDAPFQLVSNNCGSVAVNGQCAVQVRFSPTTSGSHAGSLTLSHNGAGGTSSVSLNGTGTRAVLGFSPASIAGFGNVQVGQTATSGTITLQNTGNATASSLGLSAPAGFSLQSSTCGTSLAVGGSCTFAVRFAPTVGQAYSGSVSASAAAPAINSSLAVSGTGMAQSATITNVAFGNRSVNTSTDLVATLTNTGVGPLAITVPTSGSVSGTDFSFVSTTCSSSLSHVAGSNTCAVMVRFTPTSNVARTGALTVATGAGSKASSLSGTGTRAVLGFSPASIAGFGNVQVGQTANSGTITLQNTGNATASSLGLSAPAGFSLQSSTCGTSLAAGGSCTFSVQFAPTAGQAYSGSVSASAAAPAINSSLAVSGTGMAQSATITNVAFGNRSVNTSTDLAATLTNTGVGPLSITVPTSGSVAGTDFSFVSTTCASSLSHVAGSNTCTVTVRFTPTSNLARTGTLTVPTGAGSKASSLSGTGTRAVLGFSPASIAGFGNVQVGQTADSGSVTLQNTGNETASSLALSAPAGFSIQSSSCSTSLAAGGSCSFAVRFTPTAGQAYSGNVSVTAAAPAVNGALSVSGTGVQAVAQLNPSSLQFANEAVGNTSASLTVAVANAGNIALSVSPSTSVTGDFSISTALSNCASVAPGTSCLIGVKFSPTTIGTRSGTLTIVSNHVGGNLSVSLAGTGVQGAGVSHSPASLSFGTITKMTSKSLNLTVTNSGGSTATGLSFSVTNGSGGQGSFGWSAGSCTVGGSLAPGGSCTVSVRYNASCSGGSKVGTFTTSGSNFSSVSSTLNAATSSSGLCQ